MEANDSTQQRQEDKPLERKKMPTGERASSSQSASNNNSAKQKSSSYAQQSNSKPHPQKLASLIGSLLFILSVVASCFYLWDGKPIFSQQTARQTSASASVILGEYNGELYLFKAEKKKISAYKFADTKERELCDFAGLDASFWHSSGKVILLSFAYNPQGGLYLLDVTQQQLPLEAKLITNREAAPYFPRTLSVESTLPLIWASSGKRFAFVARDKENNTQSLFIYNLDHQQNPAQTTNPPVSQHTDKLISTQPRHFKRITDLVWINGDEELVFTAINDDKENKYRIDKSGGNFSTWGAQP